MIDDKLDFKWIAGIFLGVFALLLAYYSVWMDEERETRTLYITNFGEINPFLWMTSNEVQINVNGENLPQATVRILHFQNNGKRSITADLFDRSLPITITSRKEIKSISSTNLSLDFNRLDPFRMQVKPFFLGRDESFFLHLVLGTVTNTNANQDYSVDARIADTTISVDYKVQLKGPENDAASFFVLLHTPFAILAFLAILAFAIGSEYIFITWPLLDFKKVQIFRYVGFALAICNGENIGYLAQAELKEFNIFVFVGIVFYALFWALYFYDQKQKFIQPVFEVLPTKRTRQTRKGNSTKPQTPRAKAAKNRKKPQ